MAEIKLDVEKLVNDTFGKHFGVTFDRLRELAEADRDGRCVVLPCKVGDTVYIITGCNGECDAEIEEKEIYSFLIRDDGRIYLKSDAWDGGICYADELGKIVGSPFWQGCYLTRAEAKKALQEEHE